MRLVPVLERLVRIVVEELLRALGEDDPVRLVRVQRLKVPAIRERNGPVNDCTGAYALIKPDRIKEKRREWHSR